MYNHSLDSVRKYRLKVIQELHNRLHRAGIKEHATKMTNQQFTIELEVLKQI